MSSNSTIHDADQKDKAQKRSDVLDELDLTHSPGPDLTVLPRSGSLSKENTPEARHEKPESKPEQTIIQKIKAFFGPEKTGESGEIPETQLDPNGDVVMGPRRGSTSSSPKSPSTKPDGMKEQSRDHYDEIFRWHSGQW